MFEDSAWLYSLSSIAQTDAPSRKPRPNSRRPEVGPKKLGVHQCRITVEGRVLVRNVASVKALGHHAIRTLEGEQATVNELACMNPVQLSRTCFKPTDRWLAEKPTPEAVDSHVGIVVARFNGQFITDKLDDLRQFDITPANAPFCFSFQVVAMSHDNE